MNVKTIQPTNPKKRSDFWRRLYIRLLTEDMKPDDLPPDELALELGAIEDLVDAGYMSGHVIKDATGFPAAATIRGPTLAGRIFADEQQEIVDKKSLMGRIKSGAVLFIGWVAGIVSAVII
jgi:hypothetical protein